MAKKKAKKGLSAIKAFLRSNEEFTKNKYIILLNYIIVSGVITVHPAMQVLSIRFFQIYSL